MHLVWVCGCQQVSQHSYSTLTFKVPTYLSHRPLSCRGCQAHARVGACLGVPGPASALGRACASGLRMPPPCPRPPSCLPCSGCVLSGRVSPLLLKGTRLLLVPLPWGCESVLGPGGGGRGLPTPSRGRRVCFSPSARGPGLEWVCCASPSSLRLLLP